MIREIAGVSLLVLLMLAVLAGASLLAKGRRRRRARIPRLNIID